ncbi:hypothetical protein DIPPA_18740 [Diplonema papillatum]|nr:hypothetical protein DIPPA_18740 [Diplonema papillatum]
MRRQVSAVKGHESERNSRQRYACERSAGSFHVVSQTLHRRTVKVCFPRMESHELWEHGRAPSFESEISSIRLRSNSSISPISLSGSSGPFASIDTRPSTSNV